jgi:SHS2 domain-containing protein
MSDTELEAKVFGGKISKVKRFIKAATYNQLEIKKEKGSWKSRIVFDV